MALPAGLSSGTQSRPESNYHLPLPCGRARRVVAHTKTGTVLEHLQKKRQKFKLFLSSEIVNG
jgi:hypothetical protein